LSAADPRAAARAAAYRALVEPGPEAAPHRLVALTTPDDGPTPQSLDEATEQARAAHVPLDVQLRLEAGQTGFWELAAAPCAAMTERAENAGHAALFLLAASAGAPQGVRLEPWVGAGGVGLLGFVERAAGETDAQAAARLGDALGQALVVGPSAQEVANARDELVRAAGGDPHPLWDGLLDALAPGHFGALAPRGSVTSLQAASREAILARQRELLRLPHRLAVLSPAKANETALLGAHFARWLKSPEPLRPSPCGGEVSPPARGELRLASGASAEGSYLAFRISPKASSEASLLAELLNLPGGALERALADPELVGAARALSIGSSSARALIVQMSAFEGREAEALSRIQKLFERLAAGGVLTGADIEAAAARQRAAHRFAALDPRLRLMQLLEPVPAPADANALRRLAASLRPEAAIIAHATPRGPAAPARPSAATPSKPPARRK
jgi:hypothetical protein